MKKYLLTLLILSSMIVLTSAYEQNLTYAYDDYGPAVAVSYYSYEPFPVEPGETFDVYIMLKNTGSEDTVDATCKIIDKTPFYSYGNKQINIGKLTPGFEYRMHFEIQVSGDALEGYKDLEIQCTDNPSLGSWLIKKIPIRIQYRYAILNIMDVKTTPEVLQIGKSGAISFKIVNNAESLIKDVLIEMAFDSSIAPADGATVKKIRDISQGESADVSFNVITLPTTESGIYTVPLNISYTNNEGEQNSFSTLISVKIGETPSYYVVPESILSTGAGIKEIELKFVNDGLADLQFFNVKVLDNSLFKVKSGGTMYIGDLDSDDYLTEKFTARLYWNKITIPLEITYKDKLNNEYKDYIDVELDTGRVQNVTPSSSTRVILAVLIIGGIIYYFYRKRKKK